MLHALLKVFKGRVSREFLTHFFCQSTSDLLFWKIFRPFQCSGVAAWKKVNGQKYYDVRDSIWPYLKGVCHEIFDPHFFMIRIHLGPWWTGKSIFELGFDFVEIFYHKVGSAVCNTSQGSTYILSKSKNCSSNLFFQDICVHPLKDFSWLSP